MINYVYNPYHDLLTTSLAYLLIIVILLPGLPTLILDF